jgi:hypothetical protein
LPVSFITLLYYKYMRYVFIFLAVLVTVCAEAQQVNIKTSIYFDTDSFNLTTEHHKRLNKLADTIKKLNVQGILLRGNTDADADSLYNIRLSAKRVNSVKNYLATKNIDTSKCKLDYYGENKPIADNGTDIGKKKNRRVDIILSALLTKPTPKPTTPKRDTVIKPIPVAEAVVEDTCAKDTTYTLPQGTVITMSICDYKTQQRCGGIQLNEFLNPQSVRDSSMSTADNSGGTLISGGMLGIKTCENHCLKKPIKILIPINNSCGFENSMSLWTRRRDSWVSVDLKLKIVKINDLHYFEFSITCPGMMNIDYQPTNQEITIKLPRKYKLVELSFSNDCPMWLQTIKYKKPSKKRKVHLTIPCQSIKKFKENIVYIKAINRNGDTVVMDYKRVQYLAIKNELRRPKNDDNGEHCGDRWLIFGRKNTKLKIREKDFDITIPANKNSKP